MRNIWVLTLSFLFTLPSFASSPLVPRMRYEACAQALIAVGRDHKTLSVWRNEQALLSLKDFRRGVLEVTDNSKFTYVPNWANRSVNSFDATSKGKLWAGHFIRGLETTLEMGATGDSNGLKFQSYATKIQGRKNIETYFAEVEKLHSIFRIGRRDYLKGLGLNVVKTAGAAIGLGVGMNEVVKHDLTAPFGFYFAGSFITIFAFGRIQATPTAIDWVSGGKTNSIKNFLAATNDLEKTWVVIGQSAWVQRSLSGLFYNLGGIENLSYNEALNATMGPARSGLANINLDAGQVWLYEKDEAGELQPALILYTRFGADQPAAPARAAKGGSQASVGAVSPVGAAAY